MQERPIFFEHQAARGVIDGDWKIVWGKRMPHEIDWELYNLRQDRSETTDLADRYPERVERMARMWWDYAKRTGIDVRD